MKKVSRVRRCRLCASEDILNNFYNIFDDNSELKLEMKIRKLLPVVVMSWDPMPHVVCHDCTDKLNTFNEFYETSLNTERLLRTMHRETPPNARKSLPEGEEDSEKRGGEPDESPSPKTSLGCREYVYTYRRCCRTFTEESTETVHPCAGAEECGELETEKKCLPPLKIRLFAVRSGSFVCCLCKKRFEDKGELGKHIKGHFLEGRWEEEETTGTKCNKEGGRRDGCCREGDEGTETSVEEHNSRRRRRRKRGWSLPKKRRATSRRMLEYQNGTCEESRTQEEIICPTSTSSAKETTDDQSESSKPDSSQQRDSEVNNERKSVTEEPEEAETPRVDDEVTVIQIIENRIPTTLSSCIFCDKIFATRDSLLAHKSKHLENFKSNSNRGDPFQCDVCLNTFPNERTLMEHMRGHSWDHNDSGHREPLAPLNGFSPGGTISNTWGVGTSGESEIPLVDVT